MEASVSVATGLATPVVIGLPSSLSRCLPWELQFQRLENLISPLHVGMFHLEWQGLEEQESLGLDSVNSWRESSADEAEPEANAADDHDDGTESVVSEAHSSMRAPKDPPAVEPGSSSSPLPWVSQMGVLVPTLLPKWGGFLWFFTIITYFYGDLAIYAVFVPATFRSVFPEVDIGGLHLVDEGVYTGGIVLLSLTIAPLAMFTLKKTTMLQVVTTVTRHAVFWVVIGAAIAEIAHHGVSSNFTPSPPAAKPASPMSPGMLANATIAVAEASTTAPPYPSAFPLLPSRTLLAGGSLEVRHGSIIGLIHLYRSP